MSTPILLLVILDFEVLCVLIDPVNVNRVMKEENSDDGNQMELYRAVAVREPINTRRLDKQSNAWC